MSQRTLSGVPYQNSNLFSSHYLDERIGDLDEWDCDEAAAEAMEDLWAHFVDQRDLVDAYDEDNLRTDWIDPVLSILGHRTVSETTEAREKLRVGRVEIDESGDARTILATARYKPENEDDHELDPHGYTETEPVPAMEFHGLSDAEAALVREFVPYAADEEIAGFRENAAKSISLLDRLEALTLPKLDDVEDGLERFLENKAEAEELDEKIERTDELIDQIVYELYGLTEEEIEIVEEAVGD